MKVWTKKASLSTLKGAMLATRGKEIPGSNIIKEVKKRQRSQGLRIELEIASIQGIEALKEFFSRSYKQLLEEGVDRVDAWDIAVEMTIDNFLDLYDGEIREIIGDRMSGFMEVGRIYRLTFRNSQGFTQEEWTLYEV